MEQLKGKILSDFELQHKLIRIVDIINFGGPLLSLYENTANGHLFLYDWIDRDKRQNRWLVYHCKPNKIWDFINQRINHYDLFDIESGVCYVLDIDEQLHIENAVRIDKNALPDMYLPEKEAFFEKSDCIQYDKLIQFIEIALQKRMNELPEKFETNKKEFYIWQKYFKPSHYHLHDRLLSGSYMDILANLKHYTPVKQEKKYENKMGKNITKDLNYVSASY